MNWLRPLVFFAMFIAAFSCGKNYSYQKTYQISEEKWTYADSLRFSFDIADTTNIYNLYLQIEHTTDYSFQNLYTRINTKFPSGDRLQERLSLEMANKAGVWLGKCGKKNCKLLIPIQESAYFNQEGEHTILLEQYMRQDSLPGIKSVAFLLEDTGQNR